MLEAHKGDKIPLAYDWAAGLGTTHPMIFVGLDPQGGASFYDWVLWYVHGHMGVFTYDYAAAWLQVRRRQGRLGHAAGAAATTTWPGWRCCCPRSSATT